ncbi:MAG: cytochrome ubiquinol oxidase subunit I [Bordetella sp.]|nr:cytochrome ubiquinol oxidase subunit I [Bordetella sp.]
MNIAPLQLARTQFMTSLSFLALFLAISLALAWFLLFFKIRARGAGQAGWTAAYRLWVRIFALAFVLALAAAVPVLVQLGSLWPGLMDKIGNVAGPLIGFGVLSVFVLKSCFLGVMLFGQRRVSDLAHTFAVFMVAVGQLVALGWVVALQTWMQTPDGAALIDGRYQVYDWWEVIFNPSFGWRAGATVVGAALAAAFLMIGVHALQALRRPLDDGERLAFKAAVVVALVAAALQWPVAQSLRDLTVRHQPAKAAALAGYWHSGGKPEIAVWGWPDAESQANLGAWTLQNTGQRWLALDPNGLYIGLDKYSGMQPPVALVFWSLRVAVLLGALMFVAALVSFLGTVRRGFDPGVMPRWWLRLLTGMMFSGGAAVVASLWVSLLGLQPYLVNRSITQSEVLSPVAASSLGYGLAAWGVLYFILLAAFIGMLFHAARYGVVPVRKTGGTP